MNDSIGFRIPKAGLYRYFKLIGIGMVGGLLFPWMIGLISWATVITTFFIAVFMFSVIYLERTRYKWVYLSKEGIQGLAPSRDKVFIPWSSSVTLGKRDAFIAINCISIKNTNQIHELMLPLAIAQSTEFKEALRRVAPANHPLVLAQD